MPSTHQNNQNKGSKVQGAPLHHRPILQHNRVSHHLGRGLLPNPFTGVVVGVKGRGSKRENRVGRQVVVLQVVGVVVVVVVPATPPPPSYPHGSPVIQSWWWGVVCSHCRSTPSHFIPLRWAGRHSLSTCSSHQVGRENFHPIKGRTPAQWSSCKITSPPPSPPPLIVG